jgi:hypothetical protein
MKLNENPTNTINIGCPKSMAAILDDIAPEIDALILLNILLVSLYSVIPQ